MNCKQNNVPNAAFAKKPKNSDLITTKQAEDNKSADNFMRGAQIFGPGGYLPISRSTFYDKIKRGELPPPIKLGPRISCWRKSDITAFIEKMELSND